MILELHVQTTMRSSAPRRATTFVCFALSDRRKNMLLQYCAKITCTARIAVVGSVRVPLSGRNSKAVIDA